MDRNYNHNSVKPSITRRLDYAPPRHPSPNEINANNRHDVLTSHRSGSRSPIFGRVLHRLQVECEDIALAIQGTSAVQGTRALRSVLCSLYF